MNTNLLVAQLAGIVSGLTHSQEIKKQLYKISEQANKLYEDELPPPLQPILRLNEVSSDTVPATLPAVKPVKPKKPSKGKGKKSEPVDLHTPAEDESEVPDDDNSIIE